MFYFPGVVSVTVGQPQRGGTVEGERNRHDISEIYHLLRTDIVPLIVEIKKALENQITNSIVSMRPEDILTSYVHISLIQCTSCTSFHVRQYSGPACSASGLAFVRPERLVPVSYTHLTLPTNREV